MKNPIIKFVLSLCLVVSIRDFKGQTDLFTAADRFGNVFSFQSLGINSVRPFNTGTGTVTAAQGWTCQSGYFILHYANDPFYNSSAIRNVVCQVFSDFSNFIEAPSSISTNPIHIFIGITTQAGGMASSLYVFPSFAIGGTQGYINNQVEIALKSGLNPYLNISAPLVNSTSFYSAYVDFNPLVNWNTNLNTLNIGSNELDLYTVAIHEVTHMIGFLSLMNNNGSSKLGSANNYFGLYDKYLHTPSGQPLLSSQSGTNCGGQTNIIYTPTTTAILGITSSSNPLGILNCTNALQYISPTNTVAVYTPSIYQNGSSFSHFEDQCINGVVTTCTPNPLVQGYDDLYFVMSESSQVGSCYVKRYLKQEEKNVLCDLGYSITPSNTYSSTAVLNGTSTAFTYSGSACSPTALVYGLHDGLNNNVYTYTTTGSSITLSVSTLLSNDIGTTTLSCLDLIYNNATLSYTPGNATFTVSASPAIGLVILRYFPVNASGQFGNPTYIYLYFSPIGCPAPDPCNLVMNAGFETVASGIPPCGILTVLSSPIKKLSCWENYLSTFYTNQPTLFTYSCTNSIYQLGVNTVNTTTPVTPYNNSATNSHVLGLNYTYSFANPATKNSLATPLIPEQAYNVSLWAINHNSSANLYNLNSKPVVLSIASYSTLSVPSSTSFPASLTVLAEFTIAAGTNWNQYVASFTVPSSLNNQNTLIVGINGSKTDLLNPNPGQQNPTYFTFLDDIYISPASAVTFSIPNATSCGAVSFTDLAQYASPISGNFTGVGISTINVNGTIQYNFNSSYTLASGSYPVTFNYTNTSGCAGSITQNIIISPSAPLLFSSIATCSGTNAVESFTVSNSTYTGTPFYYWMPGYLMGATQTLSPGTYTVTGQFGNCLTTQTLSFNPPSACCNSNSTTFTQTAITSSALIGSTTLKVMNSFTVQPGANLTFMYATLLMEPNVKITVAENATLDIDGSTLNTCGNFMWKGIEVLKGANLNIYRGGTIDCAIEDAETAVEVIGTGTTSTVTDIHIRNTLFNKNYLDISVANFSSTPSSLAFDLFACVFTSRIIPPLGNAFTSTILSSTSSTSGLNSPYLNSTTYPSCTLKSPYSNQKSHIAIKLNNVGLTSNSTYYGVKIGEGSNANNFNLFDSHNCFVHAVNSNVTLENNVFQNQLNTTINVPVKMHGGVASAGGMLVNSSAIIHSSTNTMKTQLNLSATGISTSNRFWDCYRAIDGFDTYSFAFTNGLMRSTQSNTNTAYAPGNAGITLATNRFEYDIAGNEFTNIANCINIPIAAGSYPPAQSTSTAPSINPIPGILASRILIYGNNFNGGSNSNSYINNAIHISNPNFFPWQSVYACTTVNEPVFYGDEMCSNIGISNNNLSNVYRGIEVNGVTGFHSYILSNTVSVKHDNVFNQSQWGINYRKSLSTDNKWGRSKIIENHLMGIGSVSVTNTQASLLFSEFNIGIASPSIVCNNLKDSYNGFVFSGQGVPSTSVIGTRWQGNKMENLYTGMLLTNTAVIGQQGSSYAAMGNEWNGTWTAGASYGIYTNNSIAANSPLVVASALATDFPTNLGGSPYLDSYAVGANITSLTTGYNFSCNEPTQITEPYPIDLDYNTAEARYIADKSLYEFLFYNDSVLGSSSDYSTFFDNCEGSSIDKFRQIEELLFEQNTADARSLLATISPTNDVEQNYVSYFTIYANALDARTNDEAVAEDDNTNLYNLAQLCPLEQGACVYQARALYNAINRTVMHYNDCGSSSFGRGSNMNTERETSKKTIEEQIWDVDLFPNPAQNQLYIVSKSDSEFLSVTISDLTGRISLTKNLQVKAKLTTVDLNLINGSYIITITNNKHEKIIKKLLIAK